MRKSCNYQQYESVNMTYHANGGDCLPIKPGSALILRIKAMRYHDIANQQSYIDTNYINACLYVHVQSCPMNKFATSGLEMTKIFRTCP